jgi:hypothetical protein
VKYVCCSCNLSAAARIIFLRCQYAADLHYLTGV